MGFLSDTYNSITKFIGKSIILPVCKGIGLTTTDMAYTAAQRKELNLPAAGNGTLLFHDLANTGRKTHELYEQGHLLEGATTAVIGTASATTKATGRGVRDIFMGNAGWNNIIAAAVGVVLGSTVGNLTGSGFAGIALTAASGLVGYFCGDRIMNGLNIDMEAMPTAIASVPSPAAG